MNYFNHRSLSAPEGRFTLTGGGNIPPQFGFIPNYQLPTPIRDQPPALQYAYLLADPLRRVAQHPRKLALRQL